MLVMHRYDLYRNNCIFYKWVVIVSQSIECWDQAKDGGGSAEESAGFAQKLAHAKVIEPSES